MNREAPAIGGQSARRSALALFACLAVAASALAAPPDALVDAGRRIFREGRLTSGEPVTAFVSGDVPVSGTQFSCQGCHGRSGMGAGEGEIRVPPVSALLFEPSAQRRRGAYDASTLGRALRDGVDPSGRVLAPLMPRYRMADADVEALAAYLRSLSAVPGPGVTDTTIRFATVFTEGVPSAVRGAVLDVLSRYFEEKNRQTRLESRRAGHGAPPGQVRPTTYRDWALDVWELSGPGETWSQQIEARYRAQPVFALIGGASEGSWAAVARFCERNEVPGLLPGTDLPDAEEGDFYTLHFSRGLYLEADLVAADLAAIGVSDVVQLFPAGGPARRAADRLAATLRQRAATSEEWPLEGDPRTWNLSSRLRAAAPAAVVLWLSRDALAAVGPLPRGARVYVSSILLERDLEGLSVEGSPLLAAHGFALPSQPDPALRRFRAWRTSRGIEPRHERLQAQAYFACLAAKEGLMHAGRFFVRDYFLDSLDHAQALPAYLPFYARASTGPGQRFLSKGGYLLPVRNGRPVVEQARWLVP